MGVAENVARFVLAADTLVNALATTRPAVDASPVPWSKIEARVQAARNEYDAAREALVGPIDANEPEEPHKPL